MKGYLQVAVLSQQSHGWNRCISSSPWLVLGSHEPRAMRHKYLQFPLANRDVSREIL